MIETTDQIQTPAANETPVPEVPAQPAAETPQPEDTAQDEVALTSQIAQLWQVHQDCQSAIKQETQQFRSLRGELGRLLHQMKGLLAKPGRAGEWSGWLRERRIPRATADRLVLRYERSLNPDGNRLTEAICEPTEQELQTLLDKIAPKLRKVLRTPASAYRFLDLLSASLAVNRKDTEEGFILVKPSAHMAVEQSVPEEAQTEPVPVTADVLEEGNVELAGTSLAQ